MSVILPTLGTTGINPVMQIMEKNLDCLIGTHFVMNGYGLEERDHPQWWRQIQTASEMKEFVIDQQAIETDHGDPLYLGFIIAVFANKSCPTDFGFCVQQFRMNRVEGYPLIKFLVENDIPVNTQSISPLYFGKLRKFPKDKMENIAAWSTSDWYDYCNQLMTNDHHSMLSKFYS
ncbi:MAG: hypothetical protein ACRCXZ_08180 [Patescibacteria group bacterium]